ncbi:hypothetical protein F7D13_03020 [Methylocystis rosea]|uniref:Uncharacterized protein n=1 Tax=Methylocystis rosea TaxID=173366 RepID=A0ABX6EE12_9HYPH|nr:hypothetical protein [Methylocystis rosea]QGM93072.1 hypothetical protein F7D13_03020 [Methylocystis rosea]
MRLSVTCRCESASFERDRKGRRALLATIVAGSLFAFVSPAAADCLIDWPTHFLCSLDTKGEASVSCRTPSLRSHKFSPGAHIYFFQGHCALSNGAASNIPYTVDGMWSGDDVQEIAKFGKYGIVKTHAHCGGVDPWLNSVTCSADVIKSGEDFSYNLEDTIQDSWGVPPYPRTANALSVQQKQQLLAEAKAQPLIVQAYAPIIVSPDDGAGIIVNQPFDIKVQSDPNYGLGWQFIYYQDPNNPKLELVKPLWTKPVGGAHQVAAFQLSKKGLWLYRTRSLSLPPSAWSSNGNFRKISVH